MSFQAIALIALFFQTPAKLEMKDITEGKGRAAQTNDVVTVEYAGSLLDGKTFDSSKGKAPLVFTLGKAEVIKGWDQGIVGMKAGGERELTIPSDLAYGDNGFGGVIPPKATLKFKVKLLRIDRTGDKIEVEQTVLKPGKGVASADGDVVDVHYLGTFLNGFKFDSSYDRKAPLHITEGHTRLIKGFVQGMEGIKEGEKRRLVIPASLGYGAQTRGPIPPNSTLVFEIEAVKITPRAIVAIQFAEDQKKLIEDQKKLKMEALAPGSGPEIKNGDYITVHFTVTLPDGKKIASTRDQNQPPASYQVGTATYSRGFDAALIGMKAGGKMKVTVPPDLGFGATGNGPVPPNATLVFEIEVVKLNP